MAHFFSQAPGAPRPGGTGRITRSVASALNIGLCVGLLGLFGVLSLVMPKPTVSEFEKRELAKNAGIFRQIPLCRGVYPRCGSVLFRHLSFREA